MRFRVCVVGRDRSRALRRSPLAGVKVCPRGASEVISGYLFLRSLDGWLQEICAAWRLWFLCDFFHIDLLSRLLPYSGIPRYHTPIG